MEPQSITLAQKDAVDRLRRQYGHGSASHAFQSLYIWQEDMKLNLYLTDEMFAVKTGIRGENAWFFPCGGEDAKRKFLKSHMDEQDFSLCYVRQEDAEWTEKHFPGKFSFWSEPTESEYLYRRSEQEDMPGRRFSKLRNHWNRAVRDHHLEAVSLNEKNIYSAIQITEEWELTHHQTGILGIRDEKASLNLLKDWEKLDLIGILLFVDGEPFAMTAGFCLTEDSFDLCMAKQREKLPGISVYAKWALYRILPDYIRTINAEEDMGIEGLRMMKRQMQPAGMIEMYNGRTKAE